MDDPIPRNVADLARDAAPLAEQLGADISIVGWVDGEWFRGGSDAVLRPGSITKVFTATAVLQCVEAGLLSLDDPVCRWMPHLRPDVTVRHLLTHSSGIDAGDLFVDTAATTTAWPATSTCSTASGRSSSRVTRARTTTPGWSPPVTSCRSCGT